MAAAGSEKTREQLLDAAEELFGEHGFDGVSVREIGARAVANSALINYHFGGKAGLYEAVIERRMQEGRALFESAVSLISATSGVRITTEVVMVAVRTLLTGWMGHVCDRPAFGQLMMREVGAGMPVASRVAQRLMPMQPFADLLTRAQEEGVIRQDIPAQHISFVIFGLHQHFMMMAPALKEMMGVDSRDPSSVGAIIETNLKILFGGLWSEGSEK